MPRSLLVDAAAALTSRSTGVGSCAVRQRLCVAGCAAGQQETASSPRGAAAHGRGRQQRPGQGARAGRAARRRARGLRRVAPRRRPLAGRPIEAQAWYRHVEHRSAVMRPVRNAGRVLERAAALASVHRPRERFLGASSGTWHKQGALCPCVKLQLWARPQCRAEARCRLIYCDRLPHAGVPGF